MTKTHIVETVEEYDENWNLLKRTVTETDETDDNPARYVHTTSPYTTPVFGVPYCAASEDG